jgi:hypothetical protein
MYDPEQQSAEVINKSCSDHCPHYQVIG